MVDGSYILSAYQDTVDDTARQVVDRPCSVRGFATLISTVNTDADSVLYLFNSASAVTSLLTVNVGNLSTEADSAISQVFMPVPGLGIRFDTGVWVKGSVESTDPLIAAVTLFYQ